MDQHLSMSAVANLVNAAASIVAETDLPDVLRRVAEAARQLTGARYAALGVIGDYGGLTEFIHVGLDRETADRIGHLPTGKGVLGLLINESKTIRLDEISDHASSYGFPLHHPPMHTFLGVPVQIGTRSFGNIYLTEKPGGFTEDDEAVVQALAVIAGAAVGTSRLRQRLDALALTEERERIARDVHDSIVQDLFGVGLTIQALASRTGDPDLSTDLESVADRVDLSITSLRALILDLRADEGSRSLKEVIGQMVRELAEPFAIDVETEVNHRGFLPSGRLLENILAITSEGASNALRHSGASRIRVKIDQVGETVVISIADDGAGFNPEIEHAGMGLANIESRVRSRGGRLDITSNDDGTLLEAVLPIGSI